MKQLALILGCILLLSHAGSSHYHQIGASAATNPLPRSSAFIPDTSINNKLFLNNGGSVYRMFGMIDSLLHDREGAFPEMYVKNESGSQYLCMIQHLGSGWNAIGEFEFGYTSDLPDSIITIPSNMFVFITGGGIYLGMPESEVLKIKGNSYTRTVNKKETLISYVIKHWDEDDTHFLRRYKMEIYYAHYICKDGKVKKVRFGFDYL